MIHLEEHEGGFRAVDAAKNEVTVEIDNWVPGGEALEIGHEVDETITGTGTEIRLPESGFLIDSSELADPRMINLNGRVRLPSGEHTLRLGACINVFVRVGARVPLEAANTSEGILIKFPELAEFTLGFRQFNDQPDDVVRVPPSAEGMAAAISLCSSRHTTETPDRSFPSERPRLPHIELDDDAVIGDQTLPENDDGIVLRTPPSLEQLFALSPLAYYVGADIDIEQRDSPVLEFGNDSIEFSSEATLTDDVSSLLRRVFYLDCLVREVGPRRLGIREFDLLERISLDPDSLYASSMADRIQAYLATPFERVSGELPRWPLTTYVDPETENIPAISYLVDRLSLVLPPRASPIDGSELVERSLGDFYRSTTAGPVAEQPIEIMADCDEAGSVQGWLAAGSPIDGFKVLPEAIENRRHYHALSAEPTTVDVVVNDEEMNDECSRVIDVYLDRATELDIDVTVERELSTDELARTFESRTDFVHYIGHCDPAGLRCRDGNLSVEQLSRSRARTFFLNACGSYSYGLELVRRGSVAGAVTFGDVLDAQATKVGVNFARMFMIGYTIDRSLHYARGQAIVNRQYAVVGDGTHVLTQGDSIQPSTIYVRSKTSDKYSIRIESNPVNLIGSVILAYNDSTPALMGNHKPFTISRDDLQKFIEVTHDPFIYNNKFYWPEELREELF